jgi:hypothetical protein
VVEMSGGGYDDVAGREAVGVSIEHGLALEFLHCFFGAEDRLAEGMIFPEILGEDFVDEVVGIVFVHFDFFEDYAALAGDIIVGECRMQHEVGEDFEGDGNILIEYLHAEADALFGGKGVHVAADGIDLAGNLLGSAVLGAFEDHVLDKMGDAVDLRRLVAGTGLEPNADGGGADVLHLLGDDGEAVGQHLTPNIADFFCHINARVELPQRYATILTHLAGLG